MVDPDFCDPHLLMDGSSPDSPEWALADSFDAITTGMENPDAFDRLMASDDPAFSGWKALVLAIDALYRSDRPACRRALVGVASSPVLSPLVPLFRSWLGPDDARPPVSLSDREALRSGELASASAAVIALHGALFVEHPLRSLAGQAEEACRQGMGNHFEALSYRILRELRSLKGCDGALLSMRYVAYCFDLLLREGLEGLDLYALVLRALGRADGFLALGLGLVERDEAAAALALHAALDAEEEGLFLTPRMRAVVEDLLSLLERRPVSRDSRKMSGKSVQLELF